MPHNAFLLDLSDRANRASRDGDDRKCGVNPPREGNDKEALEARGFEVEDEPIQRLSQEGPHGFHPPAADRQTKRSLARLEAQ